MSEPTMPTLSNEELKHDIIADVSNSYYETLKNEPEYINMTFEQLGAVCRDLATVDVNTLIATQNTALLKELLGATRERVLYEPVTNRIVNTGDKVGIDLDVDTKGSLKFIQDNGYNQAVTEFTKVINSKLAAMGGQNG